MLNWCQNRVDFVTPASPEQRGYSIPINWRWIPFCSPAKWTHPTKRVGRPGIMKAIRELIVRMAEDNPSWGYCRIQGELKKLDHRVARSTIAKTLKDQGIAPAPGRPTSWRTFLRSHADSIAAADFSGLRFLCCGQQ